MDKRQDRDQDKNSSDKAEPDAAKASPAASEGAAPASAESGAAGNDLPVVGSPQLAGGEAIEEPAVDAVHGSSNGGSVSALPALFNEPVNEAPSEPAAAASGAQPRSFRFALLAATIACAAGIGALVGSLTASGIGHQRAAQAAIPRTADARDVVEAMKAQLAELSALKASLDGANRSADAQFAKIADRLNSIERAQADPAVKLAHIADAIDRLEKENGGGARNHELDRSRPGARAPCACGETHCPCSARLGHPRRAQRSRHGGEPLWPLLPCRLRQHRARTRPRAGRQAPRRRVDRRHRNGADHVAAIADQVSVISNQ